MVQLDRCQDGWGRMKEADTAAGAKGIEDWNGMAPDSSRCASEILGEIFGGNE